MARFYFDFCQAGDCTADTVGIALANVEEAYLEVVKAAQEMWSELLKQRCDPRCCRFEVRSEAGDVLFCLPFQEVLDCCTQSRGVVHPSLFTEIALTHDYARRARSELRQEIQNSHRVLNQSHQLLAKADGLLEGDTPAPTEN